MIKAIYDVNIRFTGKGEIRMKKKKNLLCFVLPKPTPTPVPKPSLSATTLNMNKGDVRQLQVAISPGMIFFPGSNSRQETMNIDRI